tara:strand:+ start:92 stop:400 length:309 start_codon:yes stop_codon:yes gene_type:complete
MAIINTIGNSSEFVAEWQTWDQRKDQFSKPALHAMFEYLDDLSDNIGEDIALDVVALCCEWREYEDLESYNKDSGHSFEDLDDLRDNTSVIEFDGGILIGEL